ncbi:MAG: hypothetical protein B7X93_08470 [Hydrogenophilales bacterium 17-61-9]|nr:MAG: hypothetical protein B7X93_08470 [Hydrogenophilales bacterium 17-61-9]
MVVAAPETYHLVKAEAPHPLVAAALDQALFERCGIERPVPIHFLPKPRWSGCCAALEDTREGELELGDHFLNPGLDENERLDRLTLVYLHEFAHRLTPGHWHTAAFFAVNALLLVRTGDEHRRPGHGYLLRLDLYDLGEWDDVSHCTRGEALDWALKHAQELAETKMSAEGAAVEILTRYEKWKAWKAAEPARVAKARAKREADAQLIGELRSARWRWAAVGWLAGVVTILMPRFL